MAARRIAGALLVYLVYSGAIQWSELAGLVVAWPLTLAAFALVRLPVSRRWLGVARRPALYGIGVLAAYWSWSRIAAIAF